jgi:alpha,alpha-trehalase
MARVERLLASSDMRFDVRSRTAHPLEAVALAAVLALAPGCRAGGTQAPSAAPSPAGPVRYDPSRDLGALFAAVERSALFPDSKTFVDATPRFAPAAISADYARSRGEPGFDLRAFVARNFELPAAPPPAFRTDADQSMEEHIRALWPVLTRDVAPESATASTLIPLPRPYVVPGGRFREVYYWDSYFTMLGLAASGRLDLVRDMLDDFAYLVRTFGHVPNGNRTYYLSRSQPPFLAAMVALLAGATDTGQALPYLDALETEHAFWMDGEATATPAAPVRRVVRLPDGAVLNRYWDDRADARPESFRQDVDLAERVPASGRAALFRNVRASAESGWDFSSRWMRDPRDLRTLETTDIVPLDLNCLLYQEERLIAALRARRGRPGDADVARRFRAAAERRRRALMAVAWDPASGWFDDVRWRTGARVTDRPTLAAVLPLYVGLADSAEASAVAARLERDFLRPGGLVTSLVASGQQWDAPNGWAPLEWMAVAGLRRYGENALADTISGRWLALNRRVFRATGRMMEKYDVEDLARPAGGGEYPAQDGFGWTNGVAEALLAGPPAAGSSSGPE